MPSFFCYPAGMASVRQVTSVRLFVDDLEVGFDTNLQLYYIRSGPITYRGETWLTGLQYLRLYRLLHALRPDYDDTE
jgi:hypothetical protein